MVVHLAVSRRCQNGFCDTVLGIASDGVALFAKTVLAGPIVLVLTASIGNDL